MRRLDEILAVVHEGCHIGAAISLPSSGHLQVDVSLWLVRVHGGALRIEAFIRRSERSRFKPPDLPSFTDLCREADDSLFNSILPNSHHSHLPGPFIPL